MFCSQVLIIIYEMVVAPKLSSVYIALTRCIFNSLLYSGPLGQINSGYIIESGLPS